MLKSLFLTAASFGLAAAITCDEFAASLTFEDVDASVASCSYHTAGETIKITGEQSVCFSELETEIDMCRVVLNIATSPTSHNYMEVWLPSGNSPWNGRLMGTYNGGLAGCVEYKDVKYMSSKGFAVMGDNGGVSTLDQYRNPFSKTFSDPLCSIIPAQPMAPNYLTTTRQ